MIARSDNTLSPFCRLSRPSEKTRERAKRGVRRVREAEEGGILIAGLNPGGMEKRGDQE